MRYFLNLRYLFILSVVLCTACGTALPTIKPYKLDVQQGNVVTSKMLLQLRPGMTKSQVRFIMGTPLLQDSFHGNRWDYVYQMRENGKIIEQRRVILQFENELLKSVRGDVVPAGSDKAKAPEESNTGTRTVEPTKAKEKGMLDKLKFWEKDPANKDAAKNKAEDKDAPVAAPTELTSPQSASPAAEAPAEPAPAESAPASENKSMLSVPLEAAPAQAPAAEPAVTPATPEPAVTPEPANPTVAPAAVETAPVDVPAESKPAEPVSVPAKEPAPTPAYEPSSGMRFDRNLKSAPVTEDAAPEQVKAPPAPRAGNKTPPPPKDLPPETEPSFFDRMLEKIGF